MDPTDVSASNRSLARFGELLEAVDRAFELSGAGTPGWPDPHPDRIPLDEEYSRVTDVSKYRIVAARVDAWVRALTASGVAVVEDLPPGPWVGERRSSDHRVNARQVVPHVAGGLRLALAETLVDDEPFGLDLGIRRVAESPVLVAVIPDCGCDACDSGSADLLDELDGWVLTVAQGGGVHARSGEATATRTLHGWQTNDGGDHRWLTEGGPALAGLERWTGTPWL